MLYFHLRKTTGTDYIAWKHLSKIHQSRKGWVFDVTLFYLIRDKFQSTRPISVKQTTFDVKYLTYKRKKLYIYTCFPINFNGAIVSKIKFSIFLQNVANFIQFTVLLSLTDLFSDRKYVVATFESSTLTMDQSSFIFICLKDIAVLSGQVPSDGHRSIT